MFRESDQAKIRETFTAKRPLVSTVTFGGSIHVAKGTAVQAKLSRAVELASFKSGKQEPSKESAQLLPNEIESHSEDFVDVEFRALSAAMLADRPIDFSRPGVLRNSLQKLMGQTVFKDHDLRVDNWVGRVAGVTWDEGKIHEGFPPGINSVLRLDMVKDPMTVRGVLQGALHSASVTVSFEWEPSHPEMMENGTFFNRLGEEVDGRTVSLLVSAIEKYWEISLVWQGADQYAKQIDEEGRPALTYYTPNDFTHSGQQLPESASLKASYPNPGKNNQKEETEMDLLKLLSDKLGTEVTAENLSQVLEDAQGRAVQAAEADHARKLEAAKADFQKASAKVSELEKEIAALKPQAELGKKYLDDERAETVRLYTLAKGKDNAKEIILKTIQSAELEVVQAWKAEFESEAQEKLGARCKKCNSAEITRQSSVVEDKSGVAPEQPSISRESAAKVNNLHR